MTGRSDLSCRTARNWLQAPDNLAAPDAWSLTRHLEHCSACRTYHADQRALDSRLRANLDAAIAGRSVRAEVLARLHPPPAGRPALPWRPALLPRLRLHAIPLAAAITVGVLLGLFIPQFLSHQSDDTSQAIAWRAMNPSIGYPVTVDPRAPDHLLAGAHGQVYESRDAGTSWHQLAPLPPGNVVRALLVDRTNPSQYIVATKHSIYRSTDRGRHWIRAAGSLPGAMNMFLIQGQGATTFYVGPSILWKSVDGGRGWRPAGPGYIFAPDGIQALTLAPNGTLITGIWAGGVAISSDGGARWQRRARDLPRDVMDVAAPSTKELWAGTDRGVYHTTDGGATWRRSGLVGIRVTSLLVRPDFILAGATTGLYRSSDRGKTWQSITTGLPLRPYVANFSLSPARPERVYASLNTDGIFRSDDGGQTWQSASGGLPLDAPAGRDRPLLFVRGGHLWYTNSQGEDPGLLTVDDAVRAAAVSPDGVSAAYVTGKKQGWTARVLSAGGGSLAHTVAHGSGSLPVGLRWSPTSAMLAVIGARSVVVSDLHGNQWEWQIHPSDYLVDWSPEGRALLFWNERSHRVGIRSPTGIDDGTRGGLYPALPVLAPDHRHLALIDGGILQIGTWAGLRQAARVPTSCRVTSWSDDSARLLLSCGERDEIRGKDGALRQRIPVSGPAMWAPGSHDLLFFQDGALWRSGSHGMHKLVSDAAPATS